MSYHTYRCYLELLDPLSSKLLFYLNILLSRKLCIIKAKETQI